MDCDLLILGGGPAGLTAGLYGARAGMRTILLEMGMPGGQAGQTDVIENYPGFPDGISGFELAERMKAQAEKFEMKINYELVESASFQPGKLVVKSNKAEYHPRSVVVSTGASPKKLGVPGEEEFRGRGVSYCATCDGAFFRDKKVLVVGGGDSAVEEGMFLTRFVDRVVLMHRRDTLRAARVLQDRARANPKMEFRLQAVVEEIQGGGNVEGVRVRNLATGEVVEEPVNGVFIFVGMTPNTGFLANQLITDEQGYIVTNEQLGTSIPGVFAAGDVRKKPLRQVVTATGDGAIAAMGAERYVAGLD